MFSANIQLQDTSSHVSEAFKSIRTNIKFCGIDKKVLAITSCFENEGKSTISLNLAASIALAGNTVCLVDADLRKSVLANVVGAVCQTGDEQQNRILTNDSIPGLTHFLSKQKAFSDVVAKTNVENMYIIFAGPVPPNPAELLGNKLFEKAIESLKKTFDYVIIDTPPINAVIDGAIVAEQADGCILVVQSGHNSYRVVQDVIEQITKTGTPIIGSILNKVDLSKDRYGYYKGYYNGYYK